MKITTLRRATAAAALVALAYTSATAQAVIFPQEQQAGSASLTAGEGVWTLSNDLLSADFTLTDGHLFFGGSEALGLLPGTELFYVETRNDGIIPASRMTIQGEITTESLAANSLAAKGSERIPGNALHATFVYGDLTVEWSAVLRDGSHYIRTEMSLSSSEENGTMMRSIIPMNYNVASGEPSISTVGNTRGAVLASDKIFAGLETPMGINSVGTKIVVPDVSDETEARTKRTKSFRLESWTATSFSWNPGREVPSEILDLNYSDSQVIGAYGGIIFEQSGNQTVTFDYANGTHRINIVGVDLTDDDGNVVAYDYHYGYSGNLEENNVYTLDVPQANQLYTIRFFVETKSESHDSSGTIIYSCNVAIPSYYTEGFEIGSWTSDTFSWAPEESTPLDIINLGYTASQIRGAYGLINFEEDGSQSLSFVYSGGNNRLNIVGVDVLDEDGNIVTHDYHFGYSGNQKVDNTYTIDIPKTGQYTIRYFVTNTENLTSSGNIRFNSYVYGEGESPQMPDLPKSGNEYYWTITDNRDNRYVTEDGTGLVGNTDKSDASLWHFVRRDDGTWDIINGVSGNYITNTAANNAQLTTSSDAPETGWKFFKSNSDGAIIITNGTVQFNSTTSSHSYQIYNWGSGTNTSDTGCQYIITEVSTEGDITVSDTPITGLWSRNTTLEAGKTWKVGAVVGLIAPGQARRSFLAYSERERAVPWRPFTMYNSWYELNINRNNAADHFGNMTIDDCVRVVGQWKEHLYDEYGSNISTFVWDDGWDEYGPWTFNSNFPNGFTEVDNVATAMGSAIGAWLGPVGGYGTSGTYRRNYWSDKGGMQLSNPAYYQTFLTATSNLINDYNFNFFKFDGISAQGTALGPDSGTTGEENAEAIIDIEQRVREQKPDIFLNTTVGTWASPFWFQYTDAVWRQEQDFGKIGGQGSDREQWITYRDRLVYQNYVTNSPLCPINDIMTHGVILTNFGSTAKDMSYDGVAREIRAAFACGSGMVELYCDYALLNTISRDADEANGIEARPAGSLWAEIAACIQWQRDNADVLPDAHWVGGNPWDGSNANVYGWASWNGRKATLALRNPSASAQTFTFTLAEALEIPVYAQGSITLTKSFADQAVLEGLTEGEAITATQSITVTLPANSIYVFDGIDSNAANVPSMVEYEVIVDNEVEFSDDAPVPPFPGNSVTLNYTVSPKPIGDYTVEITTADTEILGIDSETATISFLAPGEASFTITVKQGDETLATKEITTIVETATVTVTLSDDATAVELPLGDTAQIPTPSVTAPAGITLPETITFAYALKEPVEGITVDATTGVVSFAEDAEVEDGTEATVVVTATTTNADGIQATLGSAEVAIVVVKIPDTAAIVIGNPLEEVDGETVNAGVATEAPAEGEPEPDILYTPAEAPAEGEATEEIPTASVLFIHGRENTVIHLDAQTVTIPDGKYVLIHGDRQIASATLDIDANILRIERGTRLGTMEITIVWRPTNPVSRAAADIEDEMQEGDIALYTVSVTNRTALDSAPELTLSKSNLTLYVGRTSTVEATKTPADVDNAVVWESANPEIATVDSTGKITAIAAGNTTISAWIEGYEETTLVSLRLSVVVASGPIGSGIESINADAAAGNATIHDLAGRRLQRIDAPGMYIVNGQKVVIR